MIESILSLLFILTVAVTMMLQGKEISKLTENIKVLDGDIHVLTLEVKSLEISLEEVIYKIKMKEIKELEEKEKTIEIANIKKSRARNKKREVKE
jgi:predicted RNase H-like nuclease (RuvC/YqgF family)